MTSVRVSVPGNSIFLVLLLLVGGFVFFIVTTLFPRASIVVHPKTSERKLTKDIILSGKTTTPDYVRFTLPATILEESLEVSAVFENAGGTPTQDFSRGSITFTNTQDQEQRLLPKTQMRHVDSNIIFLTDTPVAIPANGNITVSVTAKEKGPTGDISPGKFVIEKFSKGLQEAVPAQSETAFSGGESSDSEISQDAINAAQKKVLEQAKSDALAKLTSKAGGASIRPDLMHVEVLSQHVSVSQGSRALTYTAQANVKARAFVVSTHDIISLMTLALRGRTALDEEFLLYDASSFTLEIAQADWVSGQARVSASLTGTYAKKIGSGELTADNLPGLSEKEIIEHFAASPNVGSVDVHLSPFWVKSAPSKKNQIDVRVESAK
ncbi:MAG: hypothetical protein O3A36_03535 [bacterium]|nr:hypothetical protein [bacterium]